MNTVKEVKNVLSEQVPEEDDLTDVHCKQKVDDSIHEDTVDQITKSTEKSSILSSYSNVFEGPLESSVASEKFSVISSYSN